jgi:hypothetical protein
MKYLKIQTLNTGAWYDKDIVLLHAAFQVLVDFVEQEQPDAICDWQSGELYRHVWSEISALYAWWKDQRPARPDPLEDVEHPPDEAFTIADDGRMTFPDRAGDPAYSRLFLAIRNRVDTSRILQPFFIEMLLETPVSLVISHSF